MLKACINSFKILGNIYYISNNHRRWTNDLSFKCKPYFLSIAPEGFFTVSVHVLFKDLFDLLINIQHTGTLVASNESKVSNGQVFEINIDLKPFIIPLRKLKKTKIELNLENVVKSESVGIEFLYGHSWIVYSVCNEFYGLCQELIAKDLVLICSCEFDLDENCESSLPLFYILIPGRSLQFNMLLKKVPSKEYLRNMNLPPVSVCEENKKVANFIFESFDTVEFCPTMLCSGLHQYFCLKSAERMDNEEAVENRMEDKNIENIVRNFTGSIKKKRGRRAKDW